MAEDSPDIHTLEGLISSVETQDRLEEFLTWWERGIWEGTGIISVKECAEARLKQVLKEA